MLADWGRISYCTIWYFYNGTRRAGLWFEARLTQKRFCFPQCFFSHLPAVPSRLLGTAVQIVPFDVAQGLSLIEGKPFKRYRSVQAETETFQSNRRVACDGSLILENRRDPVGRTSRSLSRVCRQPKVFAAWIAKQEADYCSRK
jgi:hypothetical protein